MFKTIGEAALIVIVVILLFLGSFRSVLIPIVTIPLSLVGVCFVLFVLGYSINLLTLLAMVLAIGLVVDDAIVVVENIHRHIEEGLKPIDAAIVGMKEIFGPIVSMTITLAAVYAPIGFTQGLTGTLFREFAFTLAGAVIISGIVAVTLSPMMSSKLLKPHGHGGQKGFAGFVDRTFTQTRELVCPAPLGSLDCPARHASSSSRRFSARRSSCSRRRRPNWRRRRIRAPFSASSTRRNTRRPIIPQAFAAGFTDAGEKIPEIDDTFLIAGIDGGGSGFVGFKLKEWSERTKKACADEAGDPEPAERRMPASRPSSSRRPSLPGASGGLPIQYVLRTIGDPAQAYEVAERGAAEGDWRPASSSSSQNSMTYQTPRARIIVDRDRAASLGVPVSEIGTTLGALVGGRRSPSSTATTAATTWSPRSRRRTVSIPSASASTMCAPSNGIHGAALRRWCGSRPMRRRRRSSSSTSSTRRRFRRFPLPGVTTSEGLATLRGIAAEVMPTGFYEDFAGQSRLEVQEGSSIALAFGLAVIVIYLVLAAQFESFRDPFIIMMSVPLSMFGAMIFLNMGLATLNIYTEVGLITLVGLITKHGILMVEFANDLQEKHGVDNRARPSRRRRRCACVRSS